MNEENILYIENLILFSFKKEYDYIIYSIVNGIRLYLGVGWRWKVWMKLLIIDVYNMLWIYNI